MLKVNNLAGFRNSWQNWLLEQAEQVTFVYRGLIAEMFTYMIHETPQYSGESVSNWAMSSKYPIYSAHTGTKEAYEASAPRGLRHPYNKASGGGAGPNLDAMDIALAQMRSALLAITPNVQLTSKGLSVDIPKVFITNNTDWDGSASVDSIITGQPRWLRDLNTKTEAPLYAAKSYVLERYWVLDDRDVAQLVKVSA